MLLYNVSLYHTIDVFVIKGCWILPNGFHISVELTWHFFKNSHMELRVGENTRNNNTDIHSPSSPKARPANIVSYCSWGFLLKIAWLLLVNFHLTNPHPWFSTQRTSVQWIFPPFITLWTLTTLTVSYLHKSYHLQSY